MSRVLASSYGMKVVEATGNGGLVILGVRHELPDLDALLSRARDLRPVWERQRARYASAESYIRDDRYQGGMGRADRDGRRRNWGPGYVRFTRFGRSKRAFTLRSKRPYHPIPTTKTIEATIEDTLHFIVEGI